MKEPIIRIAIPSDESGVKECAKDAYEQYIEIIGSRPAPLDANFKVQIHKGHIHIAIDDRQKIIGYIVFHKESHIIHLESVAVHRSAIGQGIGRQLIEVCERHARKLGARCIQLYTNEKMTSNLSLYPYLGYTEYDRKCEDGFNRVYFEKILKTCFDLK